MGRLSFWNNDNSSFLKESLGSERLNVSYPSIQITSNPQEEHMDDYSDEIRVEHVAEVALGTFLALAAIGLAKVVMNALLD